MNLTYDDFKNGTRLYRGKLDSQFYVNGLEIYKLNNGEYFQRTDMHLLPLVGFFPDIEIYKIEGELVLVFLTNHKYTIIEKIKVIESHTTEAFTGFEPNKIYELQNGQIWQQVSDTYLPNHHSSGHVKIINDKIMMVDNWGSYPRVVLTNHKYI